MKLQIQPSFRPWHQECFTVWCWSPEADLIWVTVHLFATQLVSFIDFVTYNSNFMFSVFINTCTLCLNQSNNQLDSFFCSVPNPPGPITVLSQTVNAINFTWSLPQGMDNVTYNFSVSNGSSFAKDHNWFLMENLKSGSNYSLSVVTVGVLGYTSTAVTTINYTSE